MRRLQLITEKVKEVLAGTSREGPNEPLLWIHLKRKDLSLSISEQRLKRLHLSKPLTLNLELLKWSVDLLQLAYSLLNQNGHLHAAKQADNFTRPGATLCPCRLCQWAHQNFCCAWLTRLRLS